MRRQIIQTVHVMPPSPAWTVYCTTTQQAHCPPLFMFTMTQLIAFECVPYLFQAMVCQCVVFAVLTMAQNYHWTTHCDKLHMCWSVFMCSTQPTPKYRKNWYPAPELIFPVGVEGYQTQSPMPVWFCVSGRITVLPFCVYTPSSTPLHRTEYQVWKFKNPSLGVGCRHCKLNFITVNPCWSWLFSSRFQLFVNFWQRYFYYF